MGEPLGIGRREAAKMLGLSQRGVMYLEQQGDLVGIRDEKGRVRFKLKDVRELHRARKEKREPVAILDLDDDGSLVLKDDGQYELGERKEELRFRQSFEQKERELLLREREVVAKETLARSVQKTLPRVERALERLSWAMVAGVATQAVPDETRAALLSELAGTVQDLMQNLSGVSPDETRAPSEPPRSAA
jgi:DNA-binding transcriptional MerR regulator